jgi:hypothetical protein
VRDCGAIRMRRVANVKVGELPALVENDSEREASDTYVAGDSAGRNAGTRVPKKDGAISPAQHIMMRGIKASIWGSVHETG